MARKKKTWREKMANDKGYPKVFPIDQTKSKRWGEGTFVIPAPMEVNELMGRVPKGKLTTIDELHKLSRIGTARPSPVRSPPASSPGSPRTPPPKANWKAKSS